MISLIGNLDVEFVLCCLFWSFYSSLSKDDCNYDNYSFEELYVYTYMKNSIFVHERWYFYSRKFLYLIILYMYIYIRSF